MPRPNPRHGTQADTPEGEQARNVHHGGDGAWASAIFGVAVQEDLSTGINPWPYPFTWPAPETYARLPDSGDDRRLRAAAAAAYGLAESECVVPAAGTQAIIQVLPQLRSRSRVLVVGPTYSEHAVCWRARGHDVEEIFDLPANAGSADVVVVCNPNNPDGRRFAPEVLEILGDRLAAGGGWLIVDEAFCDLTPEYSLAPRLPRAGLVVLRSFGKFFGLAGLRLGFALADEAMADPLRRALGPWAISGPAVAIGEEALGDTAWIDATRAHLARAVERLDDLLTGHGLEVTGGTALFRLVRCPSAHEVFRALARRGVLVRHFPEREDCLRFGLPRDEVARRRLDDALTSALLPSS